MKLKTKSCFVLIFLCLFITTCSEEKQTRQITKTNCEKIKDILTDCMGLHRGAFDYVKSCGDVSYEKVSAATSCEEVFNIVDQPTSQR
jgi:hypothetical protein